MYYSVLVETEIYIQRGLNQIATYHMGVIYWSTNFIPCKSSCSKTMYCIYITLLPCSVGSKELRAKRIIVVQPHCKYNIGG